MEERTGPLTWGQYLSWVTQNAAPETNNYFKMVSFGVFPPPDATPDYLLELLDKVVAKFEGLRTTFESAGGTVRQIVHPMRSRGYRHVISDEEISDESIGWLAEPFDLTREWPVRAAVGRRADGNWGMRLAVHRMILDHEGMVILRTAFYWGFRTGSIESPHAEPDSWSPLEIAEFEQSPAGRRRDERAYAYWRETLRTAPGSLFPTARPGRPTDHRFTVKLVRGGLRPIVGELAGALAVTEPIVLTATALLALSWVAGWPVVCATTVSNNRSHREMRRSLSPMLDRSLINLVADPALAFSAWAKRVGAAMIGAYQHSHADPNTLLRAYAEVSMDRGIVLDRLPILNVMGDPAAEVVRKGRVPPATNWEAPQQDDEYAARTEPKPLDGMYIRARVLPRVVSIELMGGEEVYDLATGERIVALIPGILEGLAAHGDLTLTKLAEVVYSFAETPTDRVVIDHTRVDLARVRDLLRDCAGVTDCAVCTVPGEDGAARLHAFVVGDERVRDLYALRRAIIGRLPAYRHVLCPHWFRVVDTAPERRDSEAAWSAVPAVAEGSGWPAPLTRPARPAEQRLAEALAAAHPPMAADKVDLGVPYCLTNGRFERIPDFFAELASRQINGITVDDLMGTQPLVNLLAVPGPEEPPRSSQLP